LQIRPDALPLPGANTGQRETIAALKYISHQAAEYGWTRHLRTTADLWLEHLTKVRDRR
jgi:hypothetical protein